MQKVLFFNMNGSGLGHMNRCLAYAHSLQAKAQSYFFSLASAIDIIEAMGFPADYYISHFWSANTSYNWNCELAIRFGMMLERVQPNTVVFDGTWPFQGFLQACQAYDGDLKLVWSNRGLLKEGTKAISVDESVFDLIIQPGELGAEFQEHVLPHGGKKITVPPVVLLEQNELLPRNEARDALQLPPNEKIALFSLGPGNLKDVSGIGHKLMTRLEERGFMNVWASAPISVQDITLPENTRALSVYPLLRYLHAFDVFISAAGYNSCCEIVHTQIPSLLVPNTLLVDDQARRAHMVAANAPALVCTCETDADIDTTVDNLISIQIAHKSNVCSLKLNGASLAAKAILALSKGL